MWDGNNMNKGYLNTPLGILELKGDDDGLIAVGFTEDETSEIHKIPDALKEPAQQLREYFEGSRETFNLKLNPQGTDFQKKVWEELLKIPYSKTVSYQEIANRLNDPKVIRAAATANGKNPIAIIVPCHRVIGSDGSLTGYAGGLQRKKWLLDHENPYKQQSLF